MSELKGDHTPKRWDKHFPKRKGCVKLKEFPDNYLNKVTKKVLREVGDFNYEQYKLKDTSRLPYL